MVPTVGELNTVQVGDVLLKLLGKEPDLEQVGQSVALVDRAGAGVIACDQFVRLLATQPWCANFDVQTISQLSNVQRRYERILKEVEIMPEKHVGEVFLDATHHLFEELDVDNSGTIDVQELVVLTRRLLKGQGKDTTSFGDLEKQSREAVAKHGDGETLSFEEFVQMLGTKPWNSVIETKSARDEILLKGAALRATSPGRSADTVRDRSPGKQLYSAAYKLFHEADTNHDGMLDEEELQMLLLQLWKHMGKCMSADLRSQVCGVSLSCYPIHSLTRTPSSPLPRLISFVCICRLHGVKLQGSQSIILSSHSFFLSRAFSISLSFLFGSNATSTKIIEGWMTVC